MRFLLLTILLLTWAPITHAQSFQFYDQLSALNRIDPMQNPIVWQGSDIINGKIQDQQNKVVGSVDDIVLTLDGDVEMLSMNFDPIHLPTSIYLNYRENKIKSHSQGYSLAFDEQRIEEIYPELLASISTASSDINANLFSVSSLQGATIRTEKGKRLGEVLDVLFDKDGSEARSFYISVMQRGKRDKTIAIPYNSITIAPSANAHPDLIIEEDKMASILEYVNK